MKGPFWPEGAKKWLSRISAEPRKVFNVAVKSWTWNTYLKPLEQSKNLEETSSQKAICKGMVVQKKI